MSGEPGEGPVCGRAARASFPGDGGDVWLVDLPRDGDAGHRGGLLSDEEWHRALTFRRAGDALRYIRCHEAKRLILASYLETPPSLLVFDRGAHGKPMLRDYPGLRFNLSHSHLQAAVAVAHKEVGIDIEHIRPVSMLDQIVHHHFTETEADFIGGVAEPARLAAFYRCWTRKEAVLKAMGVGLIHPLDSFDVRPDCAGDIQVMTAGGAVWQVTDLQADDGYYASIALDAPGPIRRRRLLPDAQ